eukprot:6146014-Ditylum_brightwellii.AAC.1
MVKSHMVLPMADPTPFLNAQQVVLYFFFGSLYSSCHLTGPSASQPSSGVEKSVDTTRGWIKFRKPMGLCQM